MKGTARSLLLGSILVGAFAFSACSDDTDEPVAGSGGSDVGTGGKATTGTGGKATTGTGGKAAGGAGVGGAAVGGAGVGGAAVGGAGVGGAAAGGTTTTAGAGGASAGSGNVTSNAGKGGGVAGGPSAGAPSTGGAAAGGPSAGAPATGGAAAGGPSAGAPGTGGVTSTAGAPSAGAPSTGGTNAAGETGVAGSENVAGAAGGSSGPTTLNSWDFSADVSGWAIEIDSGVTLATAPAVSQTSTGTYCSATGCAQIAFTFAATTAQCFAWDHNFASETDLTGATITFKLQSPVTTGWSWTFAQVFAKSGSAWSWSSGTSNGPWQLSAGSAGNAQHAESLTFAPVSAAPFDTTVVKQIGIQFCAEATGNGVADTVLIDSVTITK